MTDLNLDMYSFLIKPIRDQDVQKGQTFVQRFLQGGQAVWQITLDKIESIKKLWSVTECPDEFLQHLKRIVGWTPNLDKITEGLTYTALRRLIAVSVPIWKTRSTETSIIDALYTIVPGRARLWSWFVLRWVLDITIISEEHQGRDPWVLAIQDQYWMNVRIVDNPEGTANRQLIKDMLNLMRPCGERFEIVYLHFLDLFEEDGDLTQWSQVVSEPLVTDPVVSGGKLQLLDTSQAEKLWSDVDNPELWDGCMVSARMKGSTSAAASGFGYAFFFEPVNVDGYFVQLRKVDNTLVLGKYTGGTPSTIQSLDLSTVGITLENDRWYFLRTQVTPEGATNRIQVHLDGELLINTTDASYANGAVAVLHTTNCTAECDEIEAMILPADRETVEINY